MVQTRIVVGVFGLVGVAAVAITQMSFQSQDRQYKKTLAYMHDGRQKIEERMNAMSNTVSDAVKGKK